LARLLEGPVAHYSATGRKNFLNVAIKSADLMVSVQSAGMEMHVSNLPELELAPVKLFRITGNRAYQDAAGVLVENMFTMNTEYSPGRLMLSGENAGGDDIYVNLFAAGTASLPVGGSVVELKQETRYPWDGAVKLTVSVPKARESAL
jgi:DUF1680 family protein